MTCYLGIEPIDAAPRVTADASLLRDGQRIAPAGGGDRAAENLSSEPRPNGEGARGKRPDLE